MNKKNQYVIFSIDGRKFALNILYVERVTQAVKVSEIIEKSKNILGVITVENRVIPVVDIRKIFDFPNRETELTDKLIITKIQNQYRAFLIDEICEVINESDAESVIAEDMVSYMCYVERLIRLNDEMINVLNCKMINF
jgi:purine-binding chemotaxis protein CheW